MFASDVSTTAVNPTDVAFAIANNLRVASLSIAAYEYVTSYVSPTPHADSTCGPAISSLSPLKFDFIGVRTDVGKR